MLHSVKNRKTEKSGGGGDRYFNDAFVIISHLKASYLYGFITKDEKNQGKTEEILFEFVSVFETLRSLPSVISDNMISDNCDQR